MQFENTLEFARELDRKDVLKGFREKFFFPQHNGKDVIYFIGNSLGLQPKTVSQYIQQELDDWAKFGVEGHFQARNPWVSYHELFPEQLSVIAGCLPQEIVVMNQLTVNLHLLMVSFYRPTGQRYKIICEAKAFPTDQYAFESQVRYHGFDPEDAIVEVSPRPGEHTLRTEDILATIKQHGDTVATVLFSGIQYYTGQLFDMKAITEVAHSVGAYCGFDLAHAMGNVELKLHDWDVDFATWCSYKYMNSGPGGVSGIYIHQKHIADENIPRFAGWWGHTKAIRFKMEKGFEAIPTAEGWQLSNAPVLSMAAHKASLDIFEEAGMDKLYAKGKQLAGYMHFLLNDLNTSVAGGLPQATKEQLIEVITPTNEMERGCQVSMLMQRRGKEIFDSLMKQGVMTDWREPNVIRVAAVPLYNSFEDVWVFRSIIEEIVRN
jgi:kynureninase